MSFKELYDFTQTLGPKVHRNVIRDKTLGITGIGRIKTMKTALDITKCRGFYLSATNVNSKFVAQHGTNVIVLAREGLNECWERFVYVKELMHAFDNPQEATDTGDLFEQTLNDLVPGSSSPSPQTLSEYHCFWMALSAFCPEDYRLELLADRAKGHIDDYEIALKLKIPLQNVPRMFEARYRPIIEALLK